MKRKHNTHALMILVALSALGAFGVMRGSQLGRAGRRAGDHCGREGSIYGRPLLQSRGHDAPNRTREEST